MAERVGFEPTVPLLGRMLSKHVDSSTLAPLRISHRGRGILARRILEHQGDDGLYAYDAPYFLVGGCSLTSHRGAVDGVSKSFCSSSSCTNSLAA